MKVTGVGQCSWDYLAVADGYPEKDSKKELFQWHEQGGGPVATALVALSRLGIDCQFYGVTGDDEEGNKIRRSLLNEGVDISGMLCREGACSQKAFIVIEEGSGKRTIFWKRPTGPELTVEDLGEDFLKGSDFLLLDGLMKDVSLQALDWAKEMKIPVMLDAGSLREGILEIAAASDYVVASERFALDIGWDGDANAFRQKIKTLGFGHTTITLGEKGSIAFDGGSVFRQPAFPVDVIDTTGAGDVFHGGYVYGLLNKWKLKEILPFAAAMAAMKCRKVGGRAGIPDLDEIRAFLQSHKA